ncbi:MAG: M48 family metalloprotease, partial [Candidatus Eisenbacteria bacterium]
MPTPAVSASVLVALLLPLLLATLARQRALRGRDDVEARWFCFARRIHTLIQISPLVWLIVAMQAVPQTPLLFGYLRHGDPGAAVVVFVAILAPVALLPASLGLMANEVALRLGTTEITRRETLRRGAWLLAAALVPAVLLALGAVALVRRETLAGAAFLVVAVAIAMVCLARHRKGLGLTPHSVTHGPFRDRLFELAGRAGVKLQQVYILPMRRMRLANAFAVSGQVVMVTDLLLDRLDRDEVDAILAHEIAHLKRGDPVKLALANLGGAIVPFFALQFLGWGVVATGMLLGSLAAIAFSRRIERAADREALRLGAKGAAFISGLTKLARLSHVPVRWSRWTGWWVTHPSVADRARAVGQSTGLDDAEIQRLLTGAGSSGEHYAMPASLENGGRLFSTPFKHSVLTCNGLLMVTVAVLVPAATFSLARALGVGPETRLAVTLIPLLLGPAGCLLVLNFVAVQPLLGLRRRLAERLGLGSDPAR